MDEERRRQIMAAVGGLNRHIRGHELSDFSVAGLEKGTLRLVGSFDLSYYHDIEILITGVTRLSLSCCFYVDLAEPEPFSVSFPNEEGAVLRFRDCAERQMGEIWFEGGISFLTDHVSYDQQT